MYGLISEFYDSVNRHLDYGEWADFIEKIVKREMKAQPELVLDLGCGTGRMTLELASRGYDMIGVDSSPEMLDIARERAEEAGLSARILYLLQDMRSFELYGTVELAVSCLDCVNHLLSPSELDQCFSLVHNYLSPDGIFVFDINGRYKFENIYRDSSFVMEKDSAMLVWQNDYNERSGICDFLITLFEEGEDGSYKRYDEWGRERMYTLRQIRSHLKKCGFELIGEYSDFAFSEGSDGSERIYIAARCKKEINDGR